MSLDWETHRSLLQDLYFEHTVKEIVVLMKEQHQFIASKNQYNTRFKEWGMRKKMNTVEWKYTRKVIERRDKTDRKSQVIFNDRLIEISKIRKGMSRVPNTYYSVPSPQAPSSMQISTPPDTSVHSDGATTLQSGRKRASTSLDECQTSRAKRERSTAQTVIQRYDQPAIMYNRATQMATSATTTSMIDETNLPYLKFLRSMEALQISARPQPLLEGDFFDFSVSRTISSSNTVYAMDGDECLGLFSTSGALFDEQLSHQQTESRFYESLARLLVYSTKRADDQDQLERHQELVERLPQLLQNMPEQYPGESDSNIKLCWYHSIPYVQ